MVVDTYRFKTRQEFIDEFGWDWDTKIDWVPRMNRYFGQTIDFSFNISLPKSPNPDYIWLDGFEIKISQMLVRIKFDPPINNIEEFDKLINQLI